MEGWTSILDQKLLVCMGIIQGITLSNLFINLYRSTINKRLFMDRTTVFVQLKGSCSVPVCDEIFYLPIGTAVQICCNHLHRQRKNLMFCNCRGIGNAMASRGEGGG